MLNEGLMTTQDLSVLLCVSKSTICRWRTDQKGPREISEALVWLDSGIPRYRTNEVIAFVRGDVA